MCVIGTHDDTRLLTISLHHYIPYKGPYKGADGGTIIVTPHTVSRSTLTTLGDLPTWHKVAQVGWLEDYLAKPLSYPQQPLRQLLPRSSSILRMMLSSCHKHSQTSDKQGVFRHQYIRPIMPERCHGHRHLWHSTECHTCWWAILLRFKYNTALDLQVRSAFHLGTA